MKINFLIIFILFFYIHSYIVIPFQELKNDDVYDFKDAEQLLYELSYLKLYSEFYMGKYPRPLPVFFKKDIDFFYLSNHDEDQLKSKIDYNPTKSDSFKLEEIGSFKFNEINYKRALANFNFLMTEGDINSIYKEDKVQIDANKYISYDNIKLFYEKDLNDIKYFSGYMGLAYPNNNYENSNFVKELKNNALITNTIWSVQFPDIDEDTCKKGNIVIGELPHIYEPQFYKENEYFKMKLSEIYNNNTEYSWKLNVDNVNILKNYYENTNKKEIGLSCDYIKSISIEFGAYMMYAPKKLFEQLKELYFNNLFDNGICDYKKIKTDDDKIIFIYCDKTLFEIKDRMDFPTIYIDIQQLGGPFELSYKEVFTELNDKVYFLMAFSSKDNEDNIKLGQKFLYKYQFTFDYDNREVGVYRNNLNSQKVVHRIKRAFRGKELLVYALLLIVAISFCYCYKNGYVFKKKPIDFNTANKNISHFNGDNIELGYELKNNE